MGRMVGPRAVLEALDKWTIFCSKVESNPWWSIPLTIWLYHPVLQLHMIRNINIIIVYKSHFNDSSLKWLQVPIQDRTVRLHSDSKHTCYEWPSLAVLRVGHQTAVNKAVSHQQTIVRPYFYFVLKCLNSFANQMLARNIAELVNSAHSVTLQTTHIFRPRSHHTKLKYKYTCIQIILSNIANTNSNSNITCTRRC
jgi:hypothetical protein